MVDLECLVNTAKGICFSDKKYKELFETKMYFRMPSLWKDRATLKQKILKKEFHTR